MIFLHRLGIVLYWVGYVFAILFAIVSLLIALNGLSFGGPILGLRCAKRCHLAVGTGHEVYSHRYVG
jgi:hypothetical protein